MKAYKTSKEYCQEKLLFTKLAFVEGMVDTQRRILKHYSDLNLDFLDEDKSDNDGPVEGALAHRAKVIGTKGAAGSSSI